jgi:hypothetical protein
MRFALSRDSKLRLLSILKEKYNCETLGDLSVRLGVKKKTLELWFYNWTSTLPYEPFEEYVKEIKIIEKKEDNWGKVLGGKKGRQTILKKYGLTQVKKFNSLGGKNAAGIRDFQFSKFKVDLSDIKFLEVYGALLGDGWLSNPCNPNSRWSIGLCGNLKLDKEYIEYCSNILSSLTNRKGYFYERPIGNVIEFRFRHKQFFKILNEKLKFPAGKKENLIIPKIIYALGYGKVKYVIRGIFDTDGSFYLDRNKEKVPAHPCISVHMREPLLLDQIAETLKAQGFKLYFDKHNNQIKLRGFQQLRKWMTEIGSSNSKHLNKINKALNS